MVYKNLLPGDQEIFGDFSSFTNRDICLYSHFDYEDKVDDYVFYSLQALKQCGFEIIFISTCQQIDKSDVDKLSSLCCVVIVRENFGLDFGGWAHVINRYPQILNAENLTIANDSVYGPLGDLSLFISRMNEEGYDFWGMTESYQIEPHIQSYYINFTKNVLQSSVFQSFWASYKHVKDKKKLIVKYEVSLTQILFKAGFSYGSVFGKGNSIVSVEGIYAINPSHHLWYELIHKYHSPCVKVELLRDNPFDINLNEKKLAITKTGYDYDLIRNHINRVKKYYTKANSSREINESINKIALSVKENICNMRSESVNKKPYTNTAYARKLAIMWHALKMPLVNPRDFIFIFRHVIFSGLRCLKDDLVASYHNVQLQSYIRPTPKTIYEYREQRHFSLREKEALDTDCFMMRLLEVHNKYAVVCHIYYEDLYLEMLEVIRRVPSADIYISLVEGVSDNLVETIKNDLPDCYVQVFRNHGRDVYPFVKFIQSGILYKYEAILKIHGKLSRNDKSIYGFDGESWRKNILHALVPSDGVDNLISDFLSSKKAGVLCHEDYIYGEEHVGSSEANLHMLCASLGLEFDLKEFRFPAGTMFWIKPWLLRHIDALDLKVDDFDQEPLAVDGTMAHALERFIGIVTIKAGCEILPASEIKNMSTESIVNNNGVDVIAFYLPQFHPIKENNMWWGDGFTEWNNVSKARPMFKTHYQPRIPGELGYYDLRMNEVQERQAEMANKHGLTAFAFYQYWFSGKKLLLQPIDDFMNNENIDFKFLLCWANENWTRSWDGLNKDVLLEQCYEYGWEAKYAKDISVYLKSPKYYRRGGVPVLLIYNVSAIPECKRCMDSMREVLREQGVGEVEIVAVWFYGVKYDAALYGVDGFSEFPPHRLDFLGARRDILPMLDEGFSGNIYNYEAMVDAKIEQIKSSVSCDMELGVMCGWDNSARRQFKSDIFHGSTPVIFRKWFEAAYQGSLNRKLPTKKPILFINAWNEWAEGAYLEPDVKYGTAYLEAIDSVIK